MYIVANCLQLHVFVKRCVEMIAKCKVVIDDFSYNWKIFIAVSENMKIENVNFAKSKI